MSLKNSILALLKGHTAAKDPKVMEVIQSLEGTPAPTKVECAKSGTIADGSMIETPTDFVVDAEVYTTDPDGNQIPVMDGEYIVDGTLSIVVAGGKITEASTVAEENTDTEMSEEVKQTIESLLNRIETLETENKAHATALSAITTERDQLATDKKVLDAKIVELAKAPAVTSVKQSSSSAPKKEEAPKKTFKQMTLEERIAFNLSKAN